MSEENGMKIGQVMDDKTVYAGISPDTNNPLYATVADAPLRLDFKAAATYARKLEIGGKRDFRVPSEAELKVLFDNRAAIGGFDTSVVSPGAWYQSSASDDKKTVKGLHFSSGSAYSTGAGNAAALRCVR